MQIFSSSKVKNNFSNLIDMSQYEPVVIEKEGRDDVVMMSMEEYQLISNPAVARLHKLCEEVRAEAEANGLTEDKLAELLAEEDE
ncbi:MAG: type II toxin-antitoxin system Phd/YefM family antitoxin [Prochloron sp. SP5CPC1]|nr:type II toxin-antitoxin system Phd/YefM family antitoxin [Candidatus Paraprochloron terpiosi SP5CPC1]